MAARKVKWQSPTCLRVLQLFFPNGSAPYVLVRCEAWACSRCKVENVDEIVSHLRNVAMGSDLFATDLPMDRWDAVTKKAQREHADYLGLKRHHKVKQTRDKKVYPPHARAFVVADAPLAGRGWALEPVDIAYLAAAMLDGPIVRRDWSSAWRPEPRAPRGAIGRVSCPLSVAKEARRLAGYDERQQCYPGMDPEEAAAQYTLAVQKLLEERG
jgi:hypothetical protein